jgi:hypothetical protein
MSLLMVDWSTFSFFAISLSVTDCASKDATCLLRSSIFESIYVITILAIIRARAQFMQNVLSKGDLYAFSIIISLMSSRIYS